VTFSADEDEQSVQENETPYQLRARSHTLAPINKTEFFNDAEFIIRLLYK